jgi:uncharacterized protein YunC (DUF1805 family)
MNQHVLYVDGSVKTVIMDSISYVTEANQSDIIISGSHGGTSSAGYAIDVAAGAIFFNDAGCGKNNAGIKGLELLQQHSIIAAAVDHRTAEIANGADTYANGVITHVNTSASQAGLRRGMSVRDAVELLRMRLAGSH